MWETTVPFTPVSSKPTGTQKSSLLRSLFGTGDPQNLQKSDVKPVSLTQSLIAPMPDRNSNFFLAQSWLNLTQFHFVSDTKNKSTGKFLAHLLTT